MGHEGTPTLPRPQASRERIDSFIRSYGRTENPGLPPQGVPLRELRRLENSENLWFGVDTDMVDHIVSRQALGVVSIDLKKGLVTSTH